MNCENQPLSFRFSTVQDWNTLSVCCSSCSAWKNASLVNLWSNMWIKWCVCKHGCTHVEFRGLTWLSTLTFYLVMTRSLFPFSTTDRSLADSGASPSQDYGCSQCLVFMWVLGIQANVPHFYSKWPTDPPLQSDLNYFYSFKIFQCWNHNHNTAISVLVSESRVPCWGTFTALFWPLLLHSEIIYLCIWTHIFPPLVIWI